MIKVIEEKPVPRTQVTCRSCGSVLEYGNGDLYMNYHTQVGINTLIQDYYFTCPVCGCQVDAHWIPRKEDKK